MTEAVAEVAANKKAPIKKERVLPFHKALIKFITANPSLRGSFNAGAANLFDTLISMSKLKLTETLLRNGFSLKHRHSTDFVIKEILAGGFEPTTYNQFLLPGEHVQNEDPQLYVKWFMDHGSLQDKVLVTLSDLGRLEVPRWIRPARL